jgi:hypothetical protein
VRIRRAKRLYRAEAPGKRRYSGIIEQPPARNGNFCNGLCVLCQQISSSMQRTQDHFPWFSVTIRWRWRS